MNIVFIEADCDPKQSRRGFLEFNLIYLIYRTA